jgi:hypothetical protein
MASQETKKRISNGKKAVGKKDEVTSSSSGSSNVTIPRPPNAWILYRAAKSKEYAGHQFSDHAPASSSLPAREKSVHINEGFINQQGMSKFISKMWKSETNETRAHWRGVAEEKKRQHMQQYPEYRFSPKFKIFKEEAGQDRVGKPNPQDAYANDASPSPKKARIKSTRIRSKSICVPPSTSIDHVQRSLSSAAPATPSFSLEKLDWLAESGELLDQVLHASPAAMSHTPQAQTATQSRCNTLPTTPEMLHTERSKHSTENDGFDASIAMGILSDWCESDFMLPSEPYDAGDHRQPGRSLSSNNIAIQTPDSHLPSPSSSSLSNFASALDSLWDRYSDGLVSIPELPTVKGGTDQPDALQEFSSAFLQHSFADEHSDM